MASPAKIAAEIAARYGISRRTGDSGSLMGLSLATGYRSIDAESRVEPMTEAGWSAQRDEAITEEARARGTKLLEVKTLGPSKADPNYARTRHFYEKMGFLPLEETDLWGADTPCLIMVKSVG